MFMAPELLKHEAYNGSQADVWSLGTVAYYLVTGEYPFEATSLKELKQKVFKHQKFEWVSDQALSSNCKHFISECLQGDLTKRPSFKSLLLHPFISKPSHESKSKNSERIKICAPTSP